ncbi:hypothetical protein E2320_011004 [Naja naja]|nr:hypothetical protein E2320_011004 [Naja naja]
MPEWLKLADVHLQRKYHYLPPPHPATPPVSSSCLLHGARGRIPAPFSRLEWE